MMLDIFTHIIDTILPPHPSILKLRGETHEKFVRFYSPRKFSNCTYLSSYNQKIIKAAITANKFHNHNKASLLLATLVTKWINAQADKTFIFVPIPLSKNHKQTRGYNQVTKILENIKSDKVTIQNLLIKTRETKPQTELDRALRLKNLEGVFSYKDTKMDLSEQHIILIDDVITTGATMKEAYKTLKPNLPKNSTITCLALAH